jgi:hypothetical protein
MARLLAFNAIFFLLPFAIYAGWLIATRGAASNSTDWPVKTIGYLAFAGAILMVIGLVFFLHFTGAPRSAVYHPATIDKDGRLVPGTLK